MADSDDVRHASDDEGGSEFNPLADAMGLSAATVAAGRSSAGAADDELGPSALSSFANPAQRGAAAAATSNGAVRPAPPSAAAEPLPSGPLRDEFDDDVAGTLSSMRGGGPSVSVTSKGYIDERDVATIRQAQARTAAAKKQKSEAAQLDDEFEQLEDVSSMSLAAKGTSPGAGAGTAAAPASKPAAAQFDEFADVWEDTDRALAGGAGSVGGRKVLKASKEQKKVEKQIDPKEEARLRAEEARKAAAQAEEERKREEELHGLHNATFAKLGLAPTTILAQYEKEPAATSPDAAATSSSPAGTSASQPQSARAKAAAEQRTLESNDAALLASQGAGGSKPAQPNVVEALVSAHVAASAAQQQPELSAELQQWGAVNEVREKQQAAAAAEAERAARAGKSIGIKAADAVSRDTPLGYDGALRSLTQGPTIESAAASAAAASASAEANGSAPPAAVTAESHRAFLDTLRPRLVTSDFRDVGFARALKYKLVGAPRLPSDKLETERDHVFLMALQQVDHARSIDHERMLLTLYRALTGDALAPPTYGNHWEVIGFQGNDPSTDLRGSGLFALVQLLYFAKNYRPLLLKLYQLSRDERQNFPLATLSTNVTAMVLLALRQRYKLYGEIGRRGSVYEVVNELYVAAFYHMYLEWKNGNKTIVDWNDTRAALEQEVLHNPKQLIAKFRANQGGALGSGAEGEQPPEPLEFTEIP